jgi:hypothetical protein
MSFFRHPNPAKLAANQDLHGLVECVTGKDQAIAKQAAPLLAALVDDFDEAPGTHEVLRDLESDAQPMAIYALGCILRHGFERSSHIKASAALALYRLHATGELQRIVEEVRASEHKGKKLHVDLSHCLVGAAVRANDAALASFILKNGAFSSAAEAAPAVEVLRAAQGAGAVEAVASDPSTFSAVVKEASVAAPGKPSEASNPRA